MTYRVSQKTLLNHLAKKRFFGTPGIIDGDWDFVATQIYMSLCSYSVLWFDYLKLDHILV